MIHSHLSYPCHPFLFVFIVFIVIIVVNSISPHSLLFVPYMFSSRFHFCRLALPRRRVSFYTFNVSSYSVRPEKDGNLFAEAAAYLETLPRATPAAFVKAIRSRRYVAQDAAVRAVSLAAFRHLERLRRIFCERVKADDLPPKTNLLFVGPTGCGKTFLIEILFRDILKLPTVIVDMTTYSETGYVGQDVGTILTRLLYAADLSPARACLGLVCLDEFDKLASGQNNAVFAGAGTTKDVSGLGVQRELLKLLEKAEVAVPVEITHSDYAPKLIVSTEHIAFIACGAFSGLRGLIDREAREGIGFGREPAGGDEARIAVTYTADEVELTRYFLQYGFLPELIGRFQRVVPFHALGKDELGRILKGRVLRGYRKEFALAGIALDVDNAVLEKIVTESIRKETGARAIESAFIRLLEDAAFQAYSTPGTKKIRLRTSESGAEFELE
jgi:ATP-dependent Clp protease ATP-binding subunit ClpX